MNGDVRIAGYMGANMLHLLRLQDEMELLEANNDRLKESIKSHSEEMDKLRAEVHADENTIVIGKATIAEERDLVDSANEKIVNLHRNLDARQRTIEQQAKAILEKNQRIKEVEKALDDALGDQRGGIVLLRLENEELRKRITELEREPMKPAFAHYEQKRRPPENEQRDRKDPTSESAS